MKKENGPTPAEVDTIVRDYLRESKSIPPSEDVSASKSRILSRMHPDRMQSGAWDLDQIQNAILTQAAEKYAEEHALRLQAESRLEKWGDRIWQIVLGVITALILGYLAGHGFKIG